MEGNNTSGARKWGEPAKGTVTGPEVHGVKVPLTIKLTKTMGIEEKKHYWVFRTYFPFATGSGRNKVCTADDN